MLVPSDRAVICSAKPLRSYLLADFIKRYINKLILLLLLYIHYNVLILTALGEQLRQLFEKYMTKITEFKKANCNELVPIAELNGVVSLTRLFDALATQSNGVS